MKCVDLFAGWGGFTLGAAQAGLEVVLAANHWPLAVAAHEANHPATEHRCQDLRQMDWTSLPAFDVLLASPACQPHSSASQPRRRLTATSAAERTTPLAVVACADVCEPAVIVVEAGRRLGRRYWVQHVTGHRGLPLDRPLSTITCQDQHVVVDGDRYRPLTIRETARAMGFPDSYGWPEGVTRRDAIRGLGNAVCPPVARDLLTQVVQ